MSEASSSPMNRYSPPPPYTLYTCIWYTYSHREGGERGRANQREDSGHYSTVREMLDHILDSSNVREMLNHILDSANVREMLDHILNSTNFIDLILVSTNVREMLDRILDTANMRETLEHILDSINVK